MTKFARTLNKQRVGYVNGIVKWLIVFCLLLCVPAALAEGVDEYLVYSWEVYQSMPMEEKAAFIDNFDEPQAFDDWAYLACLFSESIDEEGRALLKLTWADFDSMTVKDQQAFDESLSSQAFETWMTVAQRNPALAPLYIVDPLRCAWVDYEAMDVPQKEAFSGRFETVEDFETWMEKAQENPQLSPAVVEDYRNCTWAEFSALNLAQKEAFFELFEGSSDFEEWINAAQKRMKKAKPNTDLTWAEVEAMDIAEKEAFYESFENPEDFEAWLAQAKK